MFTHILSEEVVRQNIIEIMKAKNEWNQLEIKINVQKYDFNQCQIYLIEVNKVSSTMTLSQNWPKQLLKTGPKPAIFAFRADTQTAGRGQRQNIWSSPQGNLHLTLLIRIQFIYFPYLSMIAVSNLFKTIKTYLDESKIQKIVKIKWINDILIDFQKVSGILVKNQMIGQCLFTEIGIGINIKKMPQENFSSGQSATFLEKIIQKDISLKDLTMKLIKNFAETFFNPNIQQVKAYFKKYYEANLVYLKKEVLLYDHKYEKILGSGVFQGINQYGHVIIEGYQKPFVEGRMKLHHSAF